MSTSMKWKEASGVLVLLLVLVGLPGWLWYWRSTGIRHGYAPGTKLIYLTATADGGIWTQDRIVGYNYWWRKPKRTEEITLNQGDHVVLRVSSSDVLHSFAIPVLHLGPYDVPAGHTIEVQFDANRPGVLTFLCWQVCSPEHGNLHGRFVVKGNGAEESW
jgi:heme/copper-type cytochrome/quinol oxidase subunit 2